MMATPPPSAQDRLKQRLTQEVEAIRLFSELLRNEHQTLLDNDTERLPALADKKEDIAARLKDISGQRNAELHAQGCSANAEGIREWCEKHPEENEIAALWASLLSEAAQAKEFNRVNGELIRVRMDYNHRALETLRHGSDPFELYGSDGQSRKKGIQRINDAA